MVNIRPPATYMEAFLVSTGIVALAEIGDKTQLLAFVLATQFRRPLPIVGGIFVAFLVYIVPNLLFNKATAFKHYARRPDTIFVLIMGLIIMGVTIWQMF